MAFNLNIARKNERTLEGHLIDELIQIHGVQCLFLFSERVQEDKTVFKDFSHFKVSNEKDFKEIYLLPENMENWDGSMDYNQFGMFQNYSIELYMSAATMFELDPAFEAEEPAARTKMLNSLLITPGNQILEITHIEPFDLGVSNQFTYADLPNSYKISCRVYTPNLSDEGISHIKETIKLEEGPDGKNDDIFEYDETVDTAQIEEFFKELEIDKEEVNDEAAGKSRAGSSAFGSLG